MSKPTDKVDKLTTAEAFELEYFRFVFEARLEQERKNHEQQWKQIRELEEMSGRVLVSTGGGYSSGYLEFDAVTKEFIGFLTEESNRVIVDDNDMPELYYQGEYTDGEGGQLTDCVKVRDGEELRDLNQQELNFIEDFFG